MGGMAAMITGSESDIRRLAADEEDGTSPISMRPGRIVISGELAKVEAAVGVAKEYGIRRATLLRRGRRLASRLMESAYQKRDRR